MKKLLWIGSGGNHKPGENHPACLANNMFWHHKQNDNTLFNHLKNNYDLLYGEPNEFKIINNTITHKRKALNNWFFDLKNILFTWNYNSISKKNLEQFFVLENYIRKNYPDIKIINPISKYNLLYKKDIFFDELTQNNFGKNIPAYKIFRTVEDVLKTKLAFPYIMKANNLSGGKVSYVVKNKFQAFFYFLLMRFLQIGAPLAKLLNKKISFEKIMGVKLFDTYNKELELFVTYRILFFGNKAYYLYPHVSKNNWCVHTDMKDDTILKERYTAAYDNGIKAYNKNKELFSKIKNIVKLDTLVLDFLITKDNQIIFLEPELKYGLDLNFIEGQERRFELTQKFYKNIQNSLNIESINFDDLFN